MDGPVPEDEEVEEREPTQEELLQAAEMDEKMLEAMALNEQLRAMVAQLDDQEQQKQQEQQALPLRRTPSSPRTACWPPRRCRGTLAGT